MSAMELTSLAAAVDEIDSARFVGAPIEAARRAELAAWIAAQQGQRGSYAGLPAPTAADATCPLRLFTGEAVRSGAGRAHILGEEACRALILLHDQTVTVQDALDRASTGMLARLAAARQREIQAGREWRGEYCCGTCSCALWRHLAVGGLQPAQPEEWLAAGVRSVRAHRVGNGRWRRFPTFYTLLALSEMPAELALEELRYAAPVCERLAQRPVAAADRFASRRHALAERVLARI